MRRTLATLATLALSGITAFAVASPAGAVGTVNVTPSSNLANGTVVTVSWTGLQPNGTPSIVQCKDAPTTGAAGADCVFLTLQTTLDGSNASGAGTDTFTVYNTNGLAALDPQTTVQCDDTHFGSILVLDNINDPSSGTYKSISCQGSAVVVTPPKTLLSCTGTSLVATVNPAMSSQSSKYTKVSGKGAVAGASSESGTNAAIPADATQCVVDAGIRNGNPSTNAGTKLNPYDDQTAGQGTSGAPLTASKLTLTLDGSASCQTTGAAVTSYPQGYPLQGKAQMTFSQLGSTGKALASQQYVRLGRDGADPDASHYTVTGIVIKGVGAGGTVGATIRMVPTADAKKNLNVGDCSNGDVAASIGQVGISLADGSDQDAAADPWTVTITG